MLIIGLTGSIGTGKTTVAKFLIKEKIPVISSDDIVNKLYHYEAVDIIGKNFPGSIQNSRVNKSYLLEVLQKSPEKLKILERIVHPMVRMYEKKFLHEMSCRGEKIVFFETPLLFETNKEPLFDAVVVVTCNFETQRKRVLSRKTHTEESFLFILSKQMNEKDKVSRADYVINTEGKIEEIEKEIKKMLQFIFKKSNVKKQNA
ncbi:dephospho-CoA kinase [Candidatus Liberibacter solanacearum]|uniref:Dephospho-CoA kinase n=1 Tax=Candidatus Liberibacter solanacearum TaxID=556287 RepID=A0A3R7Q477_9HYPH|nr:dephospho-CoA kinase [Candidatus Liberibacter solanacearum]RPD37628.1 dephospho-CoA kinase [Candidatus Liberibacter solanacearum]